MNEANANGTDARSTKQARHELRKAEAGDTAAAERLHHDEQSDKAATEAVEQVASDGAGQRGVSR